MRISRFISILAVICGLAAGTAALGDDKGRGKGDPHRSSLTVPVTGTGFDGTFTIERFAQTQTGVAAVGLLNGVLTNPRTGAKSTVVKNMAWPVVHSNAVVNASSQLSPSTPEGSVVAVGLLKVSNTPVNMMQVQASCDILNLVLGPLHLDLLGLVVDLNQVVLNITGQTGAGNLLGNLLCAITGILDGPATVGQLAALVELLNQLLGILGF
jgi:hypothetical protein